MKQKNYTKRALCMSVLSMLLCCSMLIGTTFAWFTDSVTSGRNKIVAGNLDVGLNYMTKDGNWADAADPDLPEGTLFKTDGPWEPGKVVYEQFQVVNNGSLAIKYFLSFRDIIVNNVLIPNTDPDTKETMPYVFPQKTWYGEDSYMDFSLMDVLQVAYYPGTMEELQTALKEAGGTATADSRDIVEQAVENDLISFFDDGMYNAIADNFELFGALAPAGLYKGEEGAGTDALDPLHLKYDLTGTGGSGTGPDVTEGDGEPVVIDVEDATDTQEYTIFLYWEPGVIPFAYDEDLILTDDDYNLNNGKVATPMITEDMDTLFNAAYSRAVDEEKIVDGDYDSEDYWNFRANFFIEQGTTHALEIDFSVYVEATQIPHESDSFGNTYDDEVDWPSVGDVIGPGFKP